MKQFIQILRRFVGPYKRYVFLSVLFNILTAILNIFSFAAIIPILNILFKITKQQVTTLMAWPNNLKDVPTVLINNANYYVQQLITDYGTTTALLLIGLFLLFMTFLKTVSFFLSSASVMPIRTAQILRKKWK